LAPSPVLRKSATPPPRAADEAADTRANLGQRGLGREKAQHAALGLTVDQRQERVARAHRQHAGGRMVEIRQSLRLRELAPRRGAERARGDAVSAMMPPDAARPGMVTAPHARRWAGQQRRAVNW
jgi:hypothetical protein